MVGAGIIRLGSIPVKVGISSGKVAKNGKSYRATRQVNQWNRNEAGKGVTYDSEILEHIPQGKGARGEALKRERDYAEKYRETLDKNKHKRP